MSAGTLNQCGDSVEQLGEALFRLSARMQHLLRDDDQAFEAYNDVLEAWQKLDRLTR
jgi:hypothetical protein